jgi:hypothetical protein
MYYAMLGGVTAPPVSTECAPYTRPPYNDADQDLSTPITLLARDAANVNLCEELL